MKIFKALRVVIECIRLVIELIGLLDGESR